MNSSVFDRILAAILCIGVSGSPAAAQSPIYISPDFRAVNALKAVAYQYATSWSTLPKQKGWVPFAGKAQFAIPADRRVWLRLRVVNQDSLDRHLTFFFHSITITQARLYLVTASGIDSSQQTGNLLRLRDRATRQRDLSLPFSIKAGQAVEVYLTVFRRGFPERISLNLADTRYGDQTAWQDPLIFILLGFCILIFLISLAAFLLIKGWVYLFYAIYVGAGTLFLLCSFGYAPFLFAGAPWLYETAPVFFVAIALNGFLLFAMHMLQIKHPGWRGILLASPLFSSTIMISGLLYTLEVLSASAYVSCCIITAIYLILALFSIIFCTIWKTVVRGEKTYQWFLVIFISLFILVFTHLLFEANAIFLTPSIIHLIKILFVTVEILLTAVFLIVYTKKMLDEQTQVAIKASIEKEEQRNEYSDMLHNMIKNRLETMAFDLNAGIDRAVVIQQMQDTIRTCYLLEEAIQEEPEDLFSVLNNLSFNAQPFLQNEALEQYFYSELPRSLTNIHLNSKQRMALLLIVFEVINNIKKHSGYQYVKMKADPRMDQRNGYILLTLEDDGVGIANTLGQDAQYLEITPENVEEFTQKNLYHRGGTGIRRIFGLAKKIGARMAISSQKNAGTKVNLIFGIQDSTMV